MAGALPGRRIANFGFSGAGLERSFLDSAARRLDPGAEVRTLVLGVTPFSLTPRAARRSAYTRLAALGPLEVAIRVHLAPLLQRLLPMDPERVWNALVHPDRGYFEHYHPDGWVSARVVPEDPSAALGPYRRAFPGNEVDPETIEELVAWVAERRREGIEVYAFRPPTTPTMVALEAELSGFDETDFVRRFEAAGGRWLAFDSIYPTYDGSHLREDGARAFSADLAEALRSGR
jgi:hypothetical protein